MIGSSLSGVSAATRPSKRVVLAGGTQLTRRIDTPDRENAQGEQALNLVTYPWRTTLPGWHIVFLPERTGYLAMTFRLDRRIEVYVRADRSPEALAHDIAHELGHAVDVTYNNDESRALYRSLRAVPATSPWWACNSCTDLQTLAGDFAETFALLAAPSYRFYGQLASAPTGSALERIGAAIDETTGAARA